jgi:23S rRNA (cytidine1920-2'-O)/16S rRNA (cytidine1409-2'-O)-methyltransferase
MSRVRADMLLVARGLFESRARARAAIEAGLVVADGQMVLKPSAMLAPETQILAEAPHPYVSRGGVKLAAGLDAFGIDPAGAVCLDVGASTGGFTDVLLRRGAHAVTCVDTGRGQLHPAIKADARAVSLEGQDIRQMEKNWLAEPVALAVIDVSFISLKLVLPAVARLVAPDACVIALIKPQFEVGKGRIGKNGVVSDETSRIIAVAEVREAALTLGWREIGLIDSPITGGDGNREYLAGWRTPS